MGVSCLASRTVQTEDGTCRPAFRPTGYDASLGLTDWHTRHENTMTSIIDPTTHPRRLRRLRCCNPKRRLFDVLHPLYCFRSVTMTFVGDDTCCTDVTTHWTTLLRRQLACCTVIVDLFSWVAVVAVALFGVAQQHEVGGGGLPSRNRRFLQACLILAALAIFQL